MSDPAAARLSDQVARLVGALPALPGRRADVAEELLAHLLAIYGEELAATADTEAAAARALERFGDPDDLRRDLEAAVPIGERLAWFALERTRTMGRWSGLIGIAAVLIGLGFVFPAVAYLRHLTDLVGLRPEALTQTLLLFTLGVALALSGAAAAITGIVRAAALRRR